MTWARTIDDLVADVQDRIDIAGFQSRHPPATIRRRLIDSYHRMRDWMTSAGSDRWVGGPWLLDQSLTNALAVEYGVIYPSLCIPIPPAPAGTKLNIEHIRRVEALYNNEWHTVERVGLPAMQKWSNYHGTRYPEEFVMLGRGFADPSQTAYQQADPVVAGTSDTAATQQVNILLAPYVDSSIPVRIYGVPSFTMPIDGLYSLHLDGPGFDWIVIHACTKIAVRDADSGAVYQMLKQELAEAEKIIRDSILKESTTALRRGPVDDRRDRRHWGRP